MHLEKTFSFCKSTVLHLAEGVLNFAEAPIFQQSRIPKETKGGPSLQMVLGRCPHAGFATYDLNITSVYWRPSGLLDSS